MPKLKTIVFKGKVARPERFELPTLWFEAKSNGFHKSPTLNHDSENPIKTGLHALCVGVAGCTRLLLRSLQNPLHRILGASQ